MLLNSIIIDTNATINHINNDLHNMGLPMKNEF